MERGASAGHGYDYGAEGPGVIGGTTGPVPQWGDSESTTRGVTRGAKPRSRRRQHRHTHRPPGPAGPAAAVTMGSRRAHVTTAPSSHRVPGCTAPWRRGGAWRRSTAPGRGRGSGSRRETRGYRRNGDFFSGPASHGGTPGKDGRAESPSGGQRGFRGRWGWSLRKTKEGSVASRDARASPLSAGTRRQLPGLRAAGQSCEAAEEQLAVPG